jgi:hypothetical protein
MSIFGRRPDAEAIATQLIEGLENGTLTLDDTTDVNPESQPPNDECADATNAPPQSDSAAPSSSPGVTINSPRPTS